MRLFGLFIVSVLLCAAQTAGAAVVIMPSDTSRDTLLAWGQARPVLEPRANPFVSAPVALGDGVFFAGSGPNTLLGATSNYDFAGHGSWQGAALPMAGVNEAQGAMSFVFATPVSAIVAQANWAAAAQGSEPVTISIYNDADVLLEKLILSDGKVDLQTAGNYIGFIRPTADIARITFSNGFIGARDFFSRYGSNAFGLGGDWDGDGWGGNGDGGGRPASSPPLDTPQGGQPPPIFQSGGVPEPSTWAMMLFGFGAMGVMLRSSRRRQAAPAYDLSRRVQPAAPAQSGVASPANWPTTAPMRFGTARHSRASNIPFRAASSAVVLGFAASPDRNAWVYLCRQPALIRHAGAEARPHVSAV